MPVVETIAVDGAAVGDLRRERGLTQAELAKKMRRSVSAVRGVEQGVKPTPSLRFAQQLARALRVDLTEITKKDQAA